ncbi:MAG: hypothetical protein NTY22_09015 [Proteobacteria bacterium]|nr:hypothetical protein [Pseudomonadota bacterium]
MSRRVIVSVLMLCVPMFCFAKLMDSNIAKQISEEDLKKQFEEAKKSSWELKISLDYQGLDRPVLFARTYKDPMENYKERLQEERSWILKTKDLMPKDISVQNTWNTIFEKVEGVDVSYLENKTENGQSKIHKIGSNNLTPFWLVTKAIGIKDGEVITWSTHINPKKGKKMEIKLSSNNKVDSKKLFKLYESTLKDAAENKVMDPITARELSFFLNLPRKYVVYTIIDSDPLQFFKNQLRKNVDFAYGSKDIAIIDNWNSIFANVNGLEVSALGNGEYSKIIDYEREGGKRCVITKAIREHVERVKTYIWFFPIKKYTGLIEFNSENNSYKELEKTYDFILKKQ